MMKNTTSATMSGWARGYAVTKGKRRMKRALLILLVAVLLFSVCGLPATAAKTRKAGDVDGDGNITAADARLALETEIVADYVALRLAQESLGIARTNLEADVRSAEIAPGR